MEDDVKLMAKLGMKNYRFSLSWPRMFPTGDVKNINKKGVGFYNRLIDALIKHGIQPLATLYHWDLPQALQDKYGGMLNRQFIDDFTAYSEKVTCKEPPLVCRTNNFLTNIHRAVLPMVRR